MNLREYLIRIGLPMKTHFYVKLYQKFDFYRNDTPFSKHLFQTLVTDEGRLRELSEKLNQLKIVACIGLITSNMMGAAIEGIPDFADKQKKISFVLLDGMNKK